MTKTQLTNPGCSSKLRFYEEDLKKPPTTYDQYVEEVFSNLTK